MAEIKLKDEAPGIVQRFVLFIEDISNRGGQELSVTELIDFLKTRHWTNIVREIGEHIENGGLGSDFDNLDNTTDKIDKEWVRIRMERMLDKAMFIHKVFLNIFKGLLDYSSDEEADKLACYMLYFHKAYQSLKSVE
jgi:hypothetical protein